jgi:ribosome-binding ATPase YchF (GTP1/OBG family)
LILADMTNVESGLEKARKRARSQPSARPEVEILERAHELLSSDQPLRAGAFDADESKALRGYGPLTLKPWIVVANVEEGADLPAGLPDHALAISAALEAEVAGMEEAEAKELLAGFGVGEPGIDRVIAESYRALDLITFLTTGDLERGFIRAEAVGYADLVAAGSWDAAKHKGLLRVEGKDYAVQEGDVLHIRFAV